MNTKISSYVKNLTGKTFGLLTVIAFKETDLKNSFWECLCKCGNVKVIKGRNMTSGTAVSCGCLRKENSIKAATKHGQAGKTRTYRIWQNMLSRCFNEKSTGYYRYGGRGIKVCARWCIFLNFFEDMGEAVGDLSINRIDNDGNYEPGNCQWATQKEQARNTSRTVLLDYQGEIKKQKELCEEFGVSYNMVRKRIKRGWNAQDAIHVAPKK